jgi:signal transduction histidine kinase
VIERMRGVTHHLTVMIDEILTYSSIEAGREKVHATEVRADDLVSAAAAVVEPLAWQKGIAFEAPTPAPAPRLVTDVAKVRQILVNLAGNAVKFTDQGSVRLGIENGGGRVRFTVRDSGIGISPEDQARLFQPFSQVDTGLTRRHGGTGLGLYISQRLAELLGGRIELESTLGKGSTGVRGRAGGEGTGVARGGTGELAARSSRLAGAGPEGGRWRRDRGPFPAHPSPQSRVPALDSPP